MKTKEKQRPIPVQSRLSRAQEVQARSLSKKRSRPSKRGSGNINKLNNINAVSNQKKINKIKKQDLKDKKTFENIDKNLIKIKKDIEDTITGEVERILNEIYSNNLFNKNYDIKKYENYV